MDVAVIKYNAGNVYSVVNALRRLGVEPVLTDDARRIASADKVVFPGQGEAAGAMAYLRAKGRHSEEGDTDCLGVFDVDVMKFRPRRHEDKVPAMGWNSLYDMASPLFAGMQDGTYAYFVHSYYVPVCSFTAAKADYIQPYSAALCKDNFYATQFHPEKSGDAGAAMLRNFIGM